MKSRTGKIARLPKWLRDELNQRIENGEDGENILKWLNKTTACKEMLAGQFDGRPINKQNLSDWKQGGYQEWLRNQEARERVQLMVEQAQDLEGDAEGPALADRLATVLTLQLIDMTRQLESVAEPGERWKQTKEILRELHRLRREDHHARQIRLAQEKWEAEAMDKEEEAEREQEEAHKKWLLDTFDAHCDLRLKASLIGGGKFGAKWAIWEMCVKQDLPMPKWWDPKHPEFEIPPEPDQKKEECRMQNAEDSGAGGGNIEHRTSNAEHRTAVASRPQSKEQSPQSQIEDENEDEAVKASQGESRPVKAGQANGEVPSSKLQVPELDGSNETQATDTETVEERLASESGMPTPAEMNEYFTRKKKEAELRDNDE